MCLRSKILSPSVYPLRQRKSSIRHRRNDSLQYPDKILPDNFVIRKPVMKLETDQA